MVFVALFNKSPSSKEMYVESNSELLLEFGFEFGAEFEFEFEFELEFGKRGGGLNVDNGEESTFLLLFLKSYISFL